jgi:hypothetical protein
MHGSDLATGYSGAHSMCSASAKKTWQLVMYNTVALY